MLRFLDLRPRAILVRGFAKDRLEQPNKMKRRETGCPGDRGYGGGARPPSPAIDRAHGKVGSEVQGEASLGPRFYHLLHETPRIRRSLQQLVINGQPFHNPVADHRGTIGSVSAAALSGGNRASTASSIHVSIPFGPPSRVEDWYVLSGGRCHLLSMIRSR
jgi:hypothetical protein